MERLHIPEQDFVLARAVSLKGFGGRRAGELALIGKQGRISGSLFGGVADRRISETAVEMLDQGHQFDLLTVQIGDADAVNAGLACGGEAEVLLHHRSGLPKGFLEKVSTREPTALATVVAGPKKGLMVSLDRDLSALSDASVSDSDLGQVIQQRLIQQLSRRLTTLYMEQFDENLVAIEVYSPPTALVIVGQSSLASAISRQGEMLGWSSVIVEQLVEGMYEVKNIGASDALIVLSHDHSIGVPLMEAALREHPNSYVGGLGSRHTQEERRELLRKRGLSEAELESIHGPIGLDLGSKTPEETAMAICAEILAFLSNRSAKSLKDSNGPING